MKPVLIALGLVFALVIGFMTWRAISAVRGVSQRDEVILSAIEPVVSAIRDGFDVPEGQLAELASRPDTRAPLFRALHGLNRPDLMPEEHRALPAIAESDLVVWLMHPNELGTVPDEIALAEVIEREEGDPPQRYRFFVFKFRMKAPHPAAGDGWMAGVAGPYFEGQTPLQCPPGVFSRFESFGSNTPLGHLRRTEDVILRKL